MSKIVKGLPASFLVTVNNNGTPVNVNDGSWTVTANLKYQTINGTEPFPISISPSGNGSLLEITSLQTNMLDASGVGYILVFRASKTDETINLRSITQVSVVSDV